MDGGELRKLLRESEQESVSAYSLKLLKRSKSQSNRTELDGQDESWESWQGNPSVSVCRRFCVGILMKKVTELRQGERRSQM